MTHAEMESLATATKPVSICGMAFKKRKNTAIL
uniref:Uncharacterized protein n=1 Tax=Anguilla anguilla TaxID=7936 RepID=A0A0E9RGI3_ANGAN